MTSMSQSISHLPRLFRPGCSESNPPDYATDCLALRFYTFGPFVRFFFPSRSLPGSCAVFISLWQTEIVTTYLTRHKWKSKRLISSSFCWARAFPEENPSVNLPGLTGEGKPPAASRDQDHPASPILGVKVENLLAKRLFGVADCFGGAHRTSACECNKF